MKKAGFAVIVIDSLSHAWSGKDGALDLVEKARSRSNSGNSFTAWKDVTPLQNELIDAITGSSCHVIATMRVKTDYAMDVNTDGGKSRTTPRKVGLAPVQRDGVEYEFDVIGDMDTDHNLIISKSRIPALADEVIKKPGKALGETILTWLAGAPRPVEKPTFIKTAPVEMGDGEQPFVEDGPDDKDLETFQYYVEKLKAASSDKELEGLAISLQAEVKHPDLISSLRKEYASAMKRLGLTSKAK